MQSDEDKFYIKNGVPPPSREPHGTQDDIAGQLKPLKHNWRQKGPRLYCMTCPWEHATEPIFIDKILIGTDDNGKPILRDLFSK